MSPLRRSVLLVVLAAFGIALAAAITWATSQLVRQRIGLASQPLSAGQNLLPRGTRLTAPVTASRPATTTSTSRPATTTSTSPGGRSSSTSAAPAPTITTPTTRGAPLQPSTAVSGREPSVPRQGSSAGEGDSSSRRDD